MLYLVCYDVNTQTPLGQKRLRKVAQACKNYGQRAQKSVFEININKVQYQTLLHKLVEIIDDTKDNLRIYEILDPIEEHRSCYGINTVINLQDSVIL